MRRHSGFTLIELVGVIAIIAVLVGLVTVTSRVAIRRMRNVAAANNLEQIVKALELYKQKYGEYPPDGTDTKAVERHIKKRWPKYTDPKGLSQLEKLVKKVTGDNAYRALTYWLCEAEEENGHAPLVERSNAFEKESDIGNEVSGANYNMVLNCLCDTNGVPFAYFRASKASEEDSQWQSDTDVEERAKGAYAYKVEDSDSDCRPVKGYAINGEIEPFGIAVPYIKGVINVDDDTNAYEWYNKDSYQLISAGKDLRFGNADSTQTDGYYNRCLNAPSVDSHDSITEYDLDNITNFSAGKTIDELGNQGDE